MKFFVPFTIGVPQAELLYNRSKKRLEEIGFSVSNRRIKSLSYWIGSELVFQQVGHQAPNEEFVAAIFESDVGYFVSTYAANDAFAGPMRIHYSMLIMQSAVEHIVGFDQD